MRRPKKNQRGQALMVVMAGFSIVFLLLSAALVMTQYSGKTAARRLQYQGQALNAAKAGLTESLSWYRRQLGVVSTFAPRESTNDTEKESVGLVRTFEMSDTYGLYGRYTVAKTKVIDITTRKGKSGPGTVWQIESTGCVALGSSFPNDCSQAHPSIIARETVRAEIQRLNLVLPTSGAAIYARRGSGVTIGSGSKVQGGSGIGLAYPTGTGTPTTTGATITGQTAILQDGTSPAAIKIQDVFGVTTQELLAMADSNVTSLAELPQPLPSMSLIVIRGDATFNQSFPLNGSGILVVFGNLTIPANTNNIYSGVIYVTGNVSIAQPSLISGAIIAAGNGDTSTSGTGGGVTLTSSGDTAEVDYDPAMADQIRQQMGVYRFSRRMYIPGKQAN
jgi:hypothetical protein